MSKKIIDISYHNKNIDFAQLSKEASFVIIRVQYGSRKIDSKYLEYIVGCEKHGIPYGFYAYGCFVSVADAVVEATDFYNRTKGKKGQVWVLDTEDDTLDSCGPEKLAEASQAFIDTLKKLGIEKVGFYVSHHMYNKYGLDKVKADFKWIPRYGKNDGQPHVKPDFPCDIWQYTDKGRIAGISTFVDLNVLNGDKSLEWFTGSASKVTAAPQPQPNGTEFYTTNPISAKVRVKASQLRYRTGPGKEYASAGYVQKGKVYNVTANLNDWHELIIENGKKGWVYGQDGEYLELV